MKLLKRKNDVVVPLVDKRARQRSDLYPLAVEMGEQRRMLEKVLYRIQQLERREKSYKTSLASLRREVAALKSGSTARPRAAVTDIKRTTGRPTSSDFPPPREEFLADGETNFGSALSDLN